MVTCDSRTSPDTGTAAESELGEHVLPLIYELHKVTPKMLLYILPNVSAQLQAEEPEVMLLLIG